MTAGAFFFYSFIQMTLFGGATPQGYGRAVYLMPIGFLIVLVCTLLLRETLGKRV